jgi:TonB family protein
LQAHDLETVFTQISADLAQQYILSYYPTDEKNDGRFRTISVRVSTRPNMRVRARRGYYPRRTNERFSFNTGEMPASSQLVADAGKFVPQETSAQADNRTALAASNLPLERQASAPASRSSRVGPSEMNDEPSQSSNIKAPETEQPSPKREERVNKPAEPTPQPTPQPTPVTVPAPSPPATNTQPPAASSAPSSNNSAPAAAAAKPVSHGVLNGKAVYLPKPFYPPNARTARASGVVTVEVLLSEEGKVLSARAIEGNPFLRQSAVDAARQARFTPTILSGKPVQVTGLITYNFSLSQ